MRLRGKVAIVTGGASGIGAASARLFAAEGARVGICDLDRGAIDGVVGEIVSAGGEAFGQAADVSDTARVKAFVDAMAARFGALHVLFSNAGISGSGTVVELSEEGFDHTLAVNLRGAFVCSKHVIPHMERSGGGSIIFTASELALKGSRRNAAYTASKAGLIGLARSMALDHAPAKIRVNVLCPGPIDTPMLRRSIERHADSEAYERMIVDETPLGIGTAEEIARVALFLASDESSYLTGSTVVADGGATA
ncbi:MAG TPA: SDR family NAD(P)-dependent oxidoreductase [Thermomicrobiales bacterium]|nr:SDR family NAD(P)-dependent oxidoreductase [Thermomicrobiales bacterium]